jgi:hypothetical protein
LRTIYLGIVMENITFRKATNEDIELLFQIKIKAFADEFDEFK